jgi:hypothetical protein
MARVLQVAQERRTRALFVATALLLVLSIATLLIGERVIGLVPGIVVGVGLLATLGATVAILAYRLEKTAQQSLLESLARPLEVPSSEATSKVGTGDES